MNIKRNIIVPLLMALYVCAVAQSAADARAEVRGILYAAWPVDKVREVSDARLSELVRFALGNPDGELSSDDQFLAFELLLTERNRRRMTADDFSLFVQEQKESMQKYREQGQPEKLIIQAENWLDIFKLNLLLE